MSKNDEKLKELLERVEQGTREVFESERYRNYLATMSKFHSYSFRNSLLILMQRPEASYVAGYTAWQKKFHRQVQRGEKGIQIVGYTPRKVNVEQEKKDSSGNIIIGADGQPVKETVTRQVPAFAPVYVYDVSQTEGEPLPELINELKGNVEAYQDLMQAIQEVSPFPISYEDIQGGAKGYCDPLAQKIVIQQGMSEVQNIKTAIHEVTHADLHAPEKNLALNDRTDRRTREVEAESTAFVVCNHYGIDTSDYTFPYLASWSSSKELKELQSSLETIQKQAGELIDKIDTRLAELQKDRGKQLFTDEQSQEKPDYTVSVAEMEEYGFKNNPEHGIDMLPLEKEKAGEMFAKDAPVFMLYSDNTAVRVEIAPQIKEHAEQGGLFGIKSDDWSRQQDFERLAMSIAKRYDNLVGDDLTARKAHPFSIEDQESRLSVIVNRISSYDVASLDRIVDFMIADVPADQDEKRNGMIRELAGITDEYHQYQQKRLSIEVEKCGGEPVVSIKWSESPDLETGQVFPLHEANTIFKRLYETYPENQGYDKTAFYIKYKQNGEYSVYEGRQDFGDRDGSIIDHIKGFWEYELSPEQQAFHVENGNEQLVEHAKEAVEQFVPYLQAHDALGRLYDYSKKQLSDIETMLSLGATITGSDQRKAYHTAMLSYVADCRNALNDAVELPQMPDRKEYGLADIQDVVDLTPEYKADLMQMASYRKEVEAEIASEAKAAGITPDQYVSARSVAPAGRTFTIYQMKNSELTRGLKFEGLDNIKITPSLDMYDEVYSGTLPEGKGLNDIFTEFNINRPADFTGHSLSVSDVVAIEYQGTITANYVDTLGFEDIPELAAEIMLQRETEKAEFIPTKHQQKATTVKYYPINETTAKRAQDANSFSDYVPGSATAEYRRYVDEAVEIAEKQKSRVDPMYHEKIDQLLDAYARRLAENMNKSYSIESRVPSVLIAGGGNFPVQKKYKQNAARDRNMEDWQDIQGLLDKIRSTGMGGISADDPQAVAKLEAKLAKLEQAQETMKGVNAYYRKHGTLDGCTLLKPEQIKELQEGMIQSWHLEKNKPFQSYELSNNNAEIHRIRARIEELKKHEEKAYVGWEFDGGYVDANKQDNRLQIFFDEKPDADDRAELKANGFRWAPSAGAWQRQLNSNAYHAADRISCIQPVNGECPTELQRKTQQHGHEDHLVQQRVAAEIKDDYADRSGNTEAQNLSISGHACRQVDEWQTDSTIYIVGQDTENETFYYASVNEDGKTYEYSFDTQPTRAAVESNHIDYMSQRDIDRHEAECGADGSRAFPHLNDDPREQAATNDQDHLNNGKQQPKKRMSMKDRFAAAQAEADRRNSARSANSQQQQQNHDKKERGGS